MGTKTKKFMTPSGSAMTEKEQLFLEGMRNGLAPAASAAKAGYSSPVSTARSLMARPSIQDALALIQAEMSEALNVNRAAVFQMLKDAYDMAIMKEEAASMIRVASEINKMCGYYDNGNSIDDLSKHLQDATAENPFKTATTEQLEDLAKFEDE